MPGIIGNKLWAKERMFCLLLQEKFRGRNGENPEIGGQKEYFNITPFFAFFQKNLEKGKEENLHNKISPFWAYFTILDE
jgi:hypothetical protein